MKRIIVKVADSNAYRLPSKADFKKCLEEKKGYYDEVKIKSYSHVRSKRLNDGFIQ